MPTYTISIEVDEEPLHPRHDNDSNVGLLYTFSHCKYNVGDKHPLSDSDLAATALAYRAAGVPFLPVYMLDHSSQRFYTRQRSDFYAQFDQSHIGYIFLDTRKFLEQNGWKRMSKKRRAIAQKWLDNEVNAIDIYHNTTYYVATIWDNAEPDYVIDGCGSFESEEAARRWAGDVFGAMDT